MGPGNQYFGFEKPLFIDGFFKKKERRKPQLTCFECFHFELKIFKETVLKSCMHFWKKHTILTAQFKLDTKAYSIKWHLKYTELVLLPPATLCSQTVQYCSLTDVLNQIKNAR